jgi:hypothetical protein
MSRILIINIPSETHRPVCLYFCFGRTLQVYVTLPRLFIPGLSHVVKRKDLEICAFLGYYAAYISDSLSTFRDNLSAFLQGVRIRGGSQKSCQGS